MTLRLRRFLPAVKETDPLTVWAPGGKPRVVFGFTITRGKIVEIDLLADPTRLSQLDLVFLKD